MHYVIGVVGLLVFLVLAWIPSTDRRMVRRKAVPIVVLLAIQFALGLVLLRTGVGNGIIGGIDRGFGRLLGYAAEGTKFVFGDLTDVDANPSTTPPFLLGVLMPIVFISALIGILQYTRVLPVIVTVLGSGLSRINGLGTTESFFAVASALLGQSEVFISVKTLLPSLPPQRMYTLAACAMSTVSASIIGAYLQLIEPRYVITAIALNLFGAFVVVALINPYTDDDVAPATSDSDADAPGDRRPEDTPARQSFFEMLGDYILDGFKVAITVGAMLIGFIALIALLNGICSGLFGGTTFQDILGYVFSPLAFLTGIPWAEAEAAGRFMATKLVSNEVVAMLQLAEDDAGLSQRSVAIVSTFLVSFANFSSIGIIAGAVRSLNEKQGATVARFGLRLLYGATLVSFLSATVVGLIA